LASNNYSVILNTSGFTGINAGSRVLKRTDGGNLVAEWE